MTNTQTELQKLIKEQLENIKETQSFKDLDEAVENIATDEFTPEDWDNEDSALDSLREDLENMTVVDNDEMVDHVLEQLRYSWGCDINDPEETEYIINLIKNDLKASTIYMTEYKEYWTEF